VARGQPGCQGWLPQQLTYRSHANMLVNVRCGLGVCRTDLLSRIWVGAVWLLVSQCQPHGVVLRALPASRSIDTLSSCGDTLRTAAEEKS